MKKTLTLVMFVLVASLSFGQWTEQVSGTTHEIISSSFIDSNTGWMMGFNGTDEILLKTTDGGSNWTPTGFSVTIYCTSVFFYDADHGWITDSRGHLYSTTDGGNNWNPQTIVSNKYLHDVIFTDLNTGYIAGEDGMIFKTTNGGTTWDPQTSNTTQRLVHLCFTDSQTGWAGGWGGVMIHTTDGGSTWTPQTSGTVYDISGISFIDAATGWATATNYNGADGLVIHTVNGGETWTTQYNPTNYLNEIRFLNADLGYVAGWGGAIYYTGDGGQTWTTQNSGVTTTLYTIAFTDEYNGWAAGTDGVILHTTNGGFPVGITETQPSEGNGITCTPNPANGHVVLTCTTEKPGNVRVAVYDASGRIIRSVFNGYHDAGKWNLDWNTGSLNPGLYFIRIESEGRSQGMKFTVK